MSRKLFLLVFAGSILGAGAGAWSAAAPEKRIAVTIDASEIGAPISPYIYGQFIEHIGDLINRSLWAEMLDDRKFYYEITSQPAQRKPVRGRVANQWRPIGPDESVVMDRQNPYTGDQTPLIRLAGAEPRGIQQSGLALRKGKIYDGRVVLAGEPGAKVNVTLVWGPAAADRQTIPISSLRAAYAKFPLKFTAGGDANDGRIEF